MRVLIACEHSGTERDAFAARGWDAWSCDLLPSATPGNHYQGDVRDILGNGWDLLIAHPPCTDLSKVGARYWPAKQADGSQRRAIDFFMMLYNAPIAHVAVENPAGIMTKAFRRPDQYVDPWMFGDPWKKKTGWWLRGLPPLVPTVATMPEGTGYWVDGGTFKLSNQGGSGRNEGAYHPNREERQRRRNRGFTGMAAAIAYQWGTYAIQEHR